MALRGVAVASRGLNALEPTRSTTHGARELPATKRKSPYWVGSSQARRAPSRRGQESDGEHSKSAQRGRAGREHDPVLSQWLLSRPNGACGPPMLRIPESDPRRPSRSAGVPSRYPPTVQARMPRADSVALQACVMAGVVQWLSGSGRVWMHGQVSLGQAQGASPVPGWGADLRAAVSRRIPVPLIGGGQTLA